MNEKNGGWFWIHFPQNWVTFSNSGVPNFVGNRENEWDEWWVEVKMSVGCSGCSWPWIGAHWPLLSLASHQWSLLSVAIRRWPLLSVAMHWWWLVSDSRHYWPLLSLTKHLPKHIWSCDHQPAIRLPLNPKWSLKNMKTWRILLFWFFLSTINYTRTDATQDMRATVEQRQYYPVPGTHFGSLVSTQCYSDKERPYLFTGTKVNLIVSWLLLYYSPKFRLDTVQLRMKTQARCW